MSTFSTSFYIDEKKCFARCDKITSCEIAIIDSLPFPLDQIIIIAIYIKMLKHE
jgi:hypothetical protein